MTNVRPLPVYPDKPTGELLEMIKQAKSEIHADLLVQPVRAVLGSPGRILAIGQKPDWMCEYAYVEQPNPKSLKEALEWVLEIKEDPRGVTLIKMMTEIFGPGVKELPVTAKSAAQGGKKK